MRRLRRGRRDPDRRGSLCFERGVGRAEQIDEFIVDDFDDLLAGMDALDDFLAEGLGFDAVDEIAGDLEIDIGFEKSHTDLAEGVRDIGLGDFTEAAQVLEGVLELAGKRIEHPFRLGQRRRVDKGRTV